MIRRFTVQFTKEIACDGSYFDSPSKKTPTKRDGCADEKEIERRMPSQIVAASLFRREAFMFFFLCF
jgi:hypothetical protein